MNDMGDPPLTVRTTLSRVLHPVWVYSAVIFTGVASWFIIWGTHVQTIPADASDDDIGATGLLMLLDVVLGIAAVCILPLRDRAPLTIAILTSGMLMFSTSTIGAAVLAAVHLAIVGSRLAITVTGGVWMLAALGNERVFTVLGSTTNTVDTLISITVEMLFYLVLVAIGRYRRARRETLTLLRERADHVERERERDVKTAKETERLRIAREMHDVLAHRISLVSLHAGALTYRDDLPREKITEAAHVIQESTALALEELRGLLGVLRNTGTDDQRSPQPTLEHLPILLAEARATGVSVAVEFSGIETSREQPLVQGLDETTSRVAYRVVQEALTNARKHAPGEPVRLRLTRDGGSLLVESHNRISENTPAAPSSRMGLIGLTERVELAGGAVDSEETSSDFTLRARLPWD